LEIIYLPEDFDLVDQYYECDGIAFQRLYDRYQNRISDWIYAIAIGPTLQDVEDLRQEVLEKSLRALKRKQLDRSGDFRGWLYTVIRSVVIDWGRRENKNIRISGEKVTIKLSSLDKEDMDIDRFHHDTKTPLDNLLDEERRQIVRECIEKLPPLDREILLLRLLGYDNKEIAEMKNTTKTAIKVRVSRAYTKLRNMLQLKREKGEI